MPKLKWILISAAILLAIIGALLTRSSFDDSLAYVCAPLVP